MESERYCFKIEFDHYDSSNTYYGLDKLNLNNIIFDNTYMKDYLSYQMMLSYGVNSPLCSYVYITVNGEDFGLYLAVEGVEESFLQRNYGNDYGELYKPDSLDFGGNDLDFDFDTDALGDLGDFDAESFDAAGFDTEDFDIESFDMEDFDIGSFSAEDFSTDDMSELFADATGDSSGMDFSSATGDSSGMDFSSAFGNVFSMFSSEDVKLQYIDDDPDSYSNIFDNAKTDITDADKERLIDSLESLSNYEDLEEVLDIDQVLRYMVIQTFTVNGDGYTGTMVHNYYLYEEDGQLSMIPWDYNLAYDTFTAGDATSAVNDPIDDELEDRPMQAWIFSSEEYTELYHEYYAEFLETVDIQGIIDEAYALIAEYVEMDPTRFCTYEEFETGVEALSEFCSLRTESIEGQLDGSIPSTSEGQSADSSALVDAGDLNLSDMGSNSTASSGMDIGGMDFGDTAGISSEAAAPDGDFDPGDMDVSAFGDFDASAFAGMEFPDANTGTVNGETETAAQAGASAPEETVNSVADESSPVETNSSTDVVEAEGTEDSASSDSETDAGQSDAIASENQEEPTEDDSGDTTSAMPSVGDISAWQSGTAGSADEETTALILLGASALVLLAGLAIAAGFRRW
ncbi:MAG: CotH kinase family protein [Lachnospiraceae bacterium]|nr:CotH kinase family protein [Lachnospiraceae bacterium]